MYPTRPSEAVDHSRIRGKRIRLASSLDALARETIEATGVGPECEKRPLDCIMVFGDPGRIPGTVNGHILKALWG
jgi:hypothetical protein